MPKPEQGRIILVEVGDTQNRNIKIRPAVIVSRTEEIKSEGMIGCVAISSAIPDKVPDDCVLLPFASVGKSRTGLRMRSAAVCSWLFEITEHEIEKYIGAVSAKCLKEILERIERPKTSE